MLNGNAVGMFHSCETRNIIKYLITATVIITFLLIRRLTSKNNYWFRELVYTNETVYRQDYRNDINRRLTESVNVTGTTREFMLCTKMPMDARLGNQMFSYASAIGLAHTQGFTAVMEQPISPLFNIFQLTSKHIPAVNKVDKKKYWHLFKEKDCCVYDHRVRNLGMNQNQYLIGYFQSWKYFSNRPEQKIIRDEFRFKDDILFKAMAFISNVTSTFSKLVPDDMDKNATNHIHLVGLHIRRGDLKEGYNIGRGYLMAPVSYIHKAMRYFEVKYNSTKLIFVICSDDKKWSKTNIVSQASPIVVSEETNGAVDLAILSLCGDVIMTVGTYGWWAGWLVGGTVIYWKEWPKPRSTLDRHFNNADFYPSSWIPMIA